MAVYLVNTSELTSIADSIRSKCNIETSLEFPSAFCDAISNVQTLSSPESVNITPTESEQIITAGVGYDGINTATLYGISSDYLGTNISRNTNSNITTLNNMVNIPSGYYSSVVNKSIINGSIYIPAQTINTNLDISINNSGIVNVVANKSEYIFPSINSGYINSGISGVISLDGYNMFQIQTQSESTVLPSNSNITVINSGIYTLSNIMAGAISTSYIGSGITQKTSQMYIPASTNVVIPSGQYLIESQTISGDENLIASNIRKNAQIYGVTGTYENSEYTIFEDAFIARTLSGTYINSRVNYINGYAFYGTQVSAVVFSNCTTIYSSAFAYCSMLQNINFPICSKVYNYAFTHCSNLTTVFCPSVETIVYGAFAYCINLSYIDLPNVSFLGESCFANTGLVSMSIPKCTTISAYCFINCNSLPYVYGPSVKTIGYGAFANCYNLQNVSFPLCSIIGYSAFRSCSALISISFPLCELVQYSAFFTCVNLISVDLPVCSKIGSSAFYGCSGLVSVNIPVCETLESFAFFNCGSLNYINAPSVMNISASALCRTKISIASFPCVTSVESYAFTNCYNLETVFMPSCTFIGNNTFAYCSNLKSIYFSTLSSISATFYSIFYGCSNIETLYMPQISKMPSRIGISYYQNTTIKYIDFSAISSFNTTLERCPALEYVNAPSVSIIPNYQFLEDSKLSLANFPLVTSVGEYAFAYCYSLSQISFSLCTTISDSAFYNCSNLEEVTLFCDVLSSNNNALIGRGAFASCSKLKSIQFSACISIYRGAFSDCSSLSSVNFPNVSYIDSNAFKNCSSLEIVNFPNVLSVEYNAFSDCSNLSFASLPLLSSISNGIFTNCTNLSNIYAPNISGIAYSAFYNCTNLESIDFPLCNFIGGGAFYGCTKLSFLSLAGFNYTTALYNQDFASCPLKTIYTPLVAVYGAGLSAAVSTLETVTAGNSYAGSFSNFTNLQTFIASNCYGIYNNAFLNCSKLTTVILKSSNFSYTSYVGESAFANCYNLQIFELGCCTAVWSNAFLNCSSLATISLSNVEFIHQSAFCNCINLTSIYLYGSTVTRSLFGNPFDNTPIMDSTLTGSYGSIYVPSSLLTDYQTTWSFISDRFVGI